MSEPLTREEAAVILARGVLHDLTPEQGEMLVNTYGAELPEELKKHTFGNFVPKRILARYACGRWPLDDKE